MARPIRSAVSANKELRAAMHPHTQQLVEMRVPLRHARAQLAGRLAMLALVRCNFVREQAGADLGICGSSIGKARQAMLREDELARRQGRTLHARALAELDHLAQVLSQRRIPYARALALFEQQLITLAQARGGSGAMAARILDVHPNTILNHNRRAQESARA